MKTSVWAPPPPPPPPPPVSHPVRVKKMLILMLMVRVKKMLILMLLVRVKKMVILMLMVRVKKMVITTPWMVQDSKGCHVSHPVRVKKMLLSSTSATTCT